MLVGNNAVLVRELEAMALLDNRFSQMRLVNMPNGQQRGYFSLVFKAYDEVEQRQVALKFYDLDPTKHDYYRLQCFDREHQILTTLRGANRCLQVVSPMSAHVMQIPTAAGNPPYVELKARYFAVDWLDSDIDDFFLRQHEHSALEKLVLFNQVVLAVEGLHSRGIYHRDLKFDNFRCTGEGNDRVVVAIDLGTAAQIESAGLANAYPHPVGMLLYAPPEAFCGLAGCRGIGALCDIYSLGCMLFELFNAEDFYTALRNVNADFEVRIAILQSKVSPVIPDTEKLQLWDKEASHALRGLAPVDVCGLGGNVPAAISGLLRDLVAGMTSPNFRNRMHKLPEVRRRIWSAIRCLSNEALEKRRAEESRRRRAHRQELARERARRIAERQRMKELEGPNGIH